MNKHYEKLRQGMGSETLSRVSETRLNGKFGKVEGNTVFKVRSQRV